MISYVTFTDKGDRPVNEDSVGAFQKEDSYCFILCDGLGGHGMGDVASNCVKETFEEEFSALNSEGCDEFLPLTFQKAQDLLLGEQILQHAKFKMKTTAVALLLAGGVVRIGHIGDSRCYAFSKRRVVFRTLDHSVPQMLVLSREIKEKEIRNHPDRSIVLRALGTQWDEDQEYEIQKEKKIDRFKAFLLCSDGFWELIDEKNMEICLKTSCSVDEWVDKMVKIVRKNGEGKNMDNFSAVAVWIK